MSTSAAVKRNHGSAGFTLVELLVTLAILATFYGLILANYATWRGPQYVKVSANELSTNLSKLRSFALSARNLNGSPAKIYVLRLNVATPTQYIQQGLEAAPSGDVFRDAIETIKLPGGAVIQNLRLTPKGGGAVTSPTCVQVAFTLPFGRTYINPSCDFNVPKTESELDRMADANLQVTIGRPGTALTRTVVVEAISGQVYIQ
ncbi:MAG: prepilin-type N-terminal cleavage/methylation domain-containing protein [Candidatus Doudnabacteria bacterium]|nr:prepilin-type N-terminal cleavage/methylation domain-containing protein [Candidatus Doudnabacteria bacterium]